MQVFAVTGHKKLNDSNKRIARSVRLCWYLSADWLIGYSSPPQRKPMFVLRLLLVSSLLHALVRASHTPSISELYVRRTCGKLYTCAHIGLALAAHTWCFYSIFAHFIRNITVLLVALTLHVRVGLGRGSALSLHSHTFHLASISFFFSLSGFLCYIVVEFFFYFLLSDSSSISLLRRSTLIRLCLLSVATLRALILTKTMNECERQTQARTNGR